MSDVMQNYQRWMTDVNVDETTKAELRAIADQPKEIEDRFFRELEFGTGGMRGVMGAGTNRLNKYTIGRATQGLANYILKQPGDQYSAVIAHDSRQNSPEFALDTALVLAGNGIKAYVFESLRPTPELSFAVRYLKATSGVVITASHNPPEYNGYKVYGDDGCQYVPEFAEQIIAQIQSIQSFDQVKKLTREDAEAQGLLVWIGKEVDDAYVAAVVTQSLNKAMISNMEDPLKIVFTPLHGTGNLPVRACLEALGFQHVEIVAEQEHPNGMFPTVKSPNPEEREAFTLALAQAKQSDADLIIGTDPDADRIGAVVKDSSGEYVVLTGNQTGAILIEYLLSQLQQRGELPSNGVVIKTIVTSEMGAAVAKHYGAEVMNTLTGFKYIGEKIRQFEQSGSHTYLFGYEESYGYLSGTYARDKDAVAAAMLIAEAAAYYKANGKTLYDVLLGLYERHGYFLEHLESRTLKGKDGLEQIQAIMNAWRNDAPASIAGVAIQSCKDYAPGIDGLPAENVLKFFLEDGSWFCLRPSGTEPKIKVYFAVRGETHADAIARVQQLTKDIMQRVDN